jgi:hypothetical protein
MQIQGDESIWFLQIMVTRDKKKECVPSLALNVASR